MEELKQFRTRWNRWLGQKCRKDKPYWATLLNSNWSDWANKVLEKNEKTYLVKINPRENIKEGFRLAISLADMKDLYKLDELYCQDKIIR